MKKLIIMVTVILSIICMFTIGTYTTFARQVEYAVCKNEDQQTTKKVYLGDYRVTFYCGGACCCGQWAGSPTASGAWPQANYTCACGSDIPFGTTLYVEGLGEYVCEDRGVGSGCIDIFVNSHSEIPSWGLAYIPTYEVITE